jgi:hypothetical protein
LPVLGLCENESDVEAAMPTPKSEAVLEAERIYERYVKPLEHVHPGEYALVTPEGSVHFAPSLLELAWKAHKTPSDKNLLFKVGAVAACQIL